MQNKNNNNGASTSEKNYSRQNLGVVTFFKAAEQGSTAEDSLFAALDAVALDGTSWIIGKNKFYEYTANGHANVEAIFAAMTTVIKTDNARLAKESTEQRPITKARGRLRSIINFGFSKEKNA
jgi:hypothetical protein